MGTTARPFWNQARIAESHLSWSHRSARSTESSCPSTFVPPSSCSRESWGESLVHRAWTAGTCASSPSARALTQPRRRERARAKSSRRRRPRQKFSMRVYISGGLRVGSVGSPSQRITSVSRVEEGGVGPRWKEWGWGKSRLGTYRRCSGRTRNL
jgi:hypothetical protein